MTLKLFFDGGCRPNPGRMEAAVVARGRVFVAPELGDGTSSEAEWCALFYALQVAAGLHATDVVLVGDSADVIAQAGGRTKCRGVAIEHRARFAEECDQFVRVRLRLVGRAQNLAGIRLQAMRGQLYV